MCTVTYFPKGQFDYILTSNRDESIHRANALHPKIEKIGESIVLFPKDGAKKGTWVGVTENNRTLCLLNGAFEKHLHTNNYIKSRGLIVLDFFKSIPTSDLVNNYDLNKVEPFTLIIIDVLENGRSLTQLKWDGNARHIKKLNSNSAHIWSSATLYTIQQTLHKEIIFNTLNINKLDSDAIFSFHEFSTTEEPHLMKYINKSNSVETISTTQIESFGDNATIIYKSFKENNETREKIKFK